MRLIVVYNIYNLIIHMKSKTNIVVSRYNKDVDFVYRINNNKDVNVMIYDKENPNNPLNVPVNKGNEASVYLKYIIMTTYLILHSLFTMKSMRGIIQGRSLINMMKRCKVISCIII